MCEELKRQVFKELRARVIKVSKDIFSLRIRDIRTRELKDKRHLS